MALLALVQTTFFVTICLRFHFSLVLTTSKDARRTAGTSNHPNRPPPPTLHPGIQLNVARQDNPVPKALKQPTQACLCKNPEKEVSRAQCCGGPSALGCLPYPPLPGRLPPPPTCKLDPHEVLSAFPSIVAWANCLWGGEVQPCPRGLFLVHFCACGFHSDSSLLIPPPVVNISVHSKAPGSVKVQPQGPGFGRRRVHG